MFLFQLLIEERIVIGVAKGIPDNGLDTTALYYIFRKEYTKYTLISIRSKNGLTSRKGRLVVSHLHGKYIMENNSTRSILNTYILLTENLLSATFVVDDFSTRVQPHNN